MLSLYISAHTDWSTPYPSNPVYRIVTSKGIAINKPLEVIRDRSPLLPLQHAYNEGTRIHHVWQSCPQSDYIGFVQYRKYFQFFDAVPDMDRIFSRYDVVLPVPKHLGGVARQYSKVHNIHDLMLVGDIVCRMFPSISDVWTASLAKPNMYIGNMFIMRYEDFDRWCRFVFPVLQTLDSVRGFTCDADVSRYIEANYHLYSHCPVNSVSYQSRLHGFLLERLTNAFILHTFRHPLHYPLLMYRRP